MSTATARFADLGVPSDLCAHLEAAAITEPFPIQSAVIPDALAGRDVAGRAPTGSGKTLAFGLPLVARLRAAQRRRPTALVLAPTRELAEQIARELRPFVRQRHHDVVSVYGGVELRRATQGLGVRRRARRGLPRPPRGPHPDRTCVARRRRPSRHRRGRPHGRHGFPPRRATDPPPDQRSTARCCLFSATLRWCGRPSSPARSSTDPVIHEVGAKGPDISAARHIFWRVDRTERASATAQAITAMGSTIVFCRTRHGADRLASSSTGSA